MEVSRARGGASFRRQERGELDAGRRGYFQLWLQVTVTVSHHANAKGRPVPVLPRSHMRGGGIPLQTRGQSGRPCERFQLQIASAPPWAALTALRTHAHDSGSEQRGEGRFNIRHHRSC